MEIMQYILVHYELKLEWLQEFNKAKRLTGLAKIFVYQIPKEIKWS